MRSEANTSETTVSGSETGTGVTVVSGATGFVGGQLLLRLLTRTDSRIVCLVRAESAEGAAERGRLRMEELLGADASVVASRVQWLRADLEQPRLGCARATWAALTREVTEIYHCAASVSFDQSLEEAQRINVDGTHHILELATDAQLAHGRFRRFHHVSTAYVAGRTKGRVAPGYLPTDRADNFRNTYERTKARAERMLAAEGRKRCVPISIYRPSIVAGNTTDGVTDNWNVLYVPMRMAVRGQLPVFRRAGRQLVDSVGVDFVVDGMIELGRIDTDAGAMFVTHHLTAGANAFTVTNLMDAAQEQAGATGRHKPSAVKMLGPVGWKALTLAVRAAARAPKQAKKIRRSGRLAARSLDRCEVYIAYTGVSTVFDASRDHEMLRWAGIVMPSGPSFLRTIIDYALATDFGKDAGAGDSAAQTSISAGAAPSLEAVAA